METHPPGPLPLVREGGKLIKKELRSSQVSSPHKPFFTIRGSAIIVVTAVQKPLC